MSGNYSRILLISCLIVGTVIFHYATPGHLMYIHILLQALFFIPVSLSGWWFGKKGGLIAAGVITSVYIHHATTVMMPTTEMAVSNGIQILLLFIVGSLTGIYADIRTGYQEVIHGVKSQSSSILPINKKFLIYLDESETAMNAVRYVANFFGSKSEAMVTLLGVPNYPNPELFKSSDKHKEEHSKVLGSLQAAAEKAEAILLESGFAETSIETRIADSKNTRTSDAILEEQSAGGHSAIVIGRHNLSRAEEFLFGNAAIRLARQAPCPVWVIGENSAPTQESDSNIEAANY